MLPIYVINLARHTERLENFQKTNQHLKNHIHVFQGYEGNKLPRRQLILDGIITESNIYGARALGVLKSHVELWKVAAESKHGITIVEDDVIIHPSFITENHKIIDEQKSFDLIAWAYNLDWPIRLEAAKGLPTSLISYLVEVGESSDKSIIHAYGQFGEYGDKIDKSVYLTEKISPDYIKTTMFAGTPCYSLSPKGAQKLLNYLPFDDRCLNLYGTVHLQSIAVGLDISMSHFFKEMDVFLSSPFLGFSANQRGK